MKAYIYVQETIEKTLGLYSNQRFQKLKQRKAEYLIVLAWNTEEAMSRVGPGGIGPETPVREFV